MAYSWANRACKFAARCSVWFAESLMANPLVKIAVVLGIVIIAVLAVAWYDGGRETPRLIEQEVNLAEIGT